MLVDTDDQCSSRGGVVCITTQFDTAVYPNYRFFLTQGYPCNYTVSGTVVQFANNMPVAGATVCLVEIERCAETDANGGCALSNVTIGTCTLVGTASKYKTLQATAVVPGGGGDVNQAL